MSAASSRAVTETRILAAPRATVGYLTGSAYTPSRASSAPRSTAAPSEPTITGMMWVGPPPGGSPPVAPAPLPLPPAPHSNPRDASPPPRRLTLDHRRRRRDSRAGPSAILAAASRTTAGGRADV